MPEQQKGCQISKTLNGCKTHKEEGKETWIWHFAKLKKWDQSCPLSFFFLLPRLSKALIFRVATLPFHPFHQKNWVNPRKVDVISAHFNINFFFTRKHKFCTFTFVWTFYQLYVCRQALGENFNAPKITYIYRTCQIYRKNCSILENFQLVYRWILFTPIGHPECSQLNWIRLLPVVVWNPGLNG